MFSEIDIAKMDEFVLDAVESGGGRIVEYHVEDGEVVFKLADCEIEVVEDRVNQRLGHYAYPWISYVQRPRTLAVGEEKE